MKCCDITSGMLRQRITLERLESTPDGAGGYNKQWVEYARPRAKMKAMSGRERLEYQRLESIVNFRCIIRYRDDVKAADRVRYNGNVYNVRFVHDIEERRRYLEMELAQGEPA